MRVLRIRLSADYDDKVTTVDFSAAPVLAGTMTNLRRLCVSLLAIAGASVFALGAEPPDVLVPPPPLSAADAVDDEPTPQQLQELRQLAETDVPTALKLSRYLASKKQYVDAVGVLQRCLDEHPSSAELRSAVGQVYLEAGQTRCAVDWLESAYRTDPQADDVSFWLGRAYLDSGWPLSARPFLISGPSSEREIDLARGMAFGSVLASLGLEIEADEAFAGVQATSDNAEFTQQAAEFRGQLLRRLEESPRLHGRAKMGLRHDDNPGIVPTSNLFGIPVNRQRSWGLSWLGDLSYDVHRGPNTDLTVGYTLLHTTNFAASDFDILSNAVSATANRRGTWRDIPWQASLRTDYDYLAVGDRAFLQRASVTPAWAWTLTDWSAATANIRYTRLDFKGQGPLNGTLFDPDSNNYSLGTTITHQMVDRVFTTQAGYQYDRNLADGNIFDYHGHRFVAGAEWHFAEGCCENTPLTGLRLAVNCQAYFRDYDERDVFTAVNRRDDEWTITASALYPLANGWAVTMEWFLDRNESTVRFNEYKRQVFELGIQYDFHGRPFMLTDAIGPSTAAFYNSPSASGR